MTKFEKRLQRVNQFIDKFLDDLELLRRRSNPDEKSQKKLRNFTLSADCVRRQMIGA